MVVCAVFLCTIQPVRAEDIERPKESRSQVDSNIKNTSSEIEVDDYITAPALKLKIKEKIPTQIKLDGIEEQKDSESKNPEVRKAQKVEQKEPFIENNRIQSANLNETYRKELKDAIKQGKSEDEIAQIRKTYLEKRKELQKKMIEKRKILTTQKKTGSIRIFQSLQDWWKSLVTR